MDLKERVEEFQKGEESLKIDFSQKYKKNLQNMARKK